MTFIRETLSNLDYLGQKSADGRLRISNQISLGDYKQFHDNAGGLYNTALIGAGTSTYEATVIGGSDLVVPAVNGDAAIRQSYQWHNYFAGKPTKIELTASNFHAQANTIKRMGYFSTNTTTPFNSNIDGLYFENDGTTIRCKITRNGTEILNTPQASWLNQDKLGSFDPTDFNFYVIDFLYLGGAIANFWVLTEFGLTKIASYQHINVDANTFVKSPNQPIRYEIRSTGGAGTFTQICADVAVEGQLSETGIVKTFNVGSQGTPSLSTGVRYAIAAIRHQAAARNIVINVNNISVQAATADNLLVEVYFGGTTVGTPTWNNVSFSNMQAFAGHTLGAVANLVHSGGVLLTSYYVSANGTLSQEVRTNRRLGNYIDGTLEECYLCVTPLGANAVAYGAINWSEFL